ncbi:DUF6444 domain-containing protein [Paenibacillus darwinianus]|uniref:DUF6444 domain-containing protein n=1 Tax=Paenibacillus darwinianus TaxID=1380763 RepID=UPI001CC04099
MNRSSKPAKKILKVSLSSLRICSPPSSDGYKKPQPKSLRVKGARAPGGQTGHKGHTLEFAANPDHLVVHPATICSCGYD